MTLESTVVLPDALTREFLLHHRVCPKSFSQNGVLTVAAAEGSQLDALDEISLLYDCDVRVEMVNGAEVERLIERLATQAERSIELARPDGELDHGATDVRDLASQPPVVRYVNLIVRDAYDARASDIHLEATRDGLSARFRLDGALVPATAPPAELHHAVISRIKLLAELDIAERRKPQDGRIRVRLEDRELDIRVSTVPTVFGESVVLRLLDHGGRPVTLDGLGMSASLLSALQALVKKPHGLILVTGSVHTHASATAADTPLLPIRPALLMTRWGGFSRPTTGTPRFRGRTLRTDYFTRRRSAFARSPNCQLEETLPVTHSQ